MGDVVYMTREKYEELEQELEDLKKNRRKEVAENLEYAKSLGDLSENAEYQEARDLQATVERRISELEGILTSAQIVSKHEGTGLVNVGSLVSVRKKGEKEAREYSIVGSEESDTASGKISNRSPLGEALMGRKKGEVVTLSTPKGTVEYEIVRVG